ncbi:PREDICTED: TMV resistance protein N-like isoform X2 [Lupinus angustifolius]|uniref:TMV resistance protein N-like isoform X2 n=1 Tax=Lupinus angustifolius TaxID=3871 RepID=UPI00092EDD80|nr:PREDICTED: TMV resistance protein N-like isoform X2 [Lupinus angustifolius]
MAICWVCFICCWIALLCSQLLLQPPIWRVEPFQNLSLCYIQFHHLLHDFGCKGFSYSLIIISSWTDITPQSEDFELHDHLVIQVDSLRHQVPDKMHKLLDKNCEQIKSLLRMESKEVQKLGIWGMGGIGKTTAAKAVFHELSSQFDCICFLANVHEDSNRRGLNYACSRLFSELLGRDVDIDIDAPEIVPSNVMSILGNKKVLIVLDDVNSSEFVEKLIGARHDWLGAGSIVILTSRDRHVLMSARVDVIYEVEAMNFQDSLDLFSLYAFNQTHPETEYEELSKTAVSYAKGIPLALAVLGSSLQCKTKSAWESILNKLRMIPNPKIQEVMILSFNKLADAEKEIFLDIACFFEGRHIDQISRVLDACGFFADIGIKILLDKALITTDSHSCIKMHDLLQEMGRDIVYHESIENPEERSRLWNSPDVMDVLTNNRGTDAVESMFLDMTQIPNLHLSSYAFKKMPNLRLLAFDSGNSSMIKNHVSIPEGLELPANLRYLQWDGYPLNSLPSIRWEKLVDLSMPHSNLQKLWNGAQNMPMLKKIYLPFSTLLIECPDLSGSPNLESISFLGCESLGQFHQSIFTLQKLEELDVSGCTSLTSLCSKTCSPSLKRLYAVGCTNLQECSITTPGDQCKTHLYMKF